MKKFLLYFILLVLSTPIYAQPCITTNITFTSQAEIDEFIIQYPNCTEIQGDVEFDGGANITNLNGLSNITKIDGDLQIYDNTALTSLIGLEQLELITGDLDIIGNGLVNLNGLNNLNTVEGFVWIDYHMALQSLDGLNSLTTVGDFMEILDNQVLTSLAGLENLQTIQGGFVLSYNPLLTHLNGLENLNSIGGRFVIEDHPLLENIDALINLRHVGETLRIQANSNLDNILGLDGLLSVANKVRIFNNGLLEDCSINILCNQWAIGGEINIFNNSTGCSDTTEIFSKCLNGISGTIFYDYNQNQQLDSFESGIPMMEVNISPNNTRAFSNINGRYFFAADEGTTYNFETSNNPNWLLTTSPNSYSINYIAGNAINQNNDFGFIPNFSKHEFSIDQFSNATRCNSEVDFYIYPKNTGTFLETNGKVEIEFDELFTFIDAIPAPQNIDLTNRILTWDFSELYPFQNHPIQITFDMPDETSTGYLSKITTTVFRDSSAQLVEAAVADYQSVIRCSYDPNDKMVLPTGELEEHFTPKDIPLNYTIRFQNTGNDYAWDVEIRDTLDSNLDFSTFEVLFASHELQTTISENGEINFLFENIFLPDSTTDLAGSQGFVKYKIHPKQGLADFTEIKNTAHIYFDANPPIVTNTTLNTLVDEIPVSLDDINKEFHFLKIFPNPTDNFLNVSVSDILTPDNFQLEIWNILGQPLLSNPLQRNQQVNLQFFPNGLYWIGLKDISTNKMKQVSTFIIKK